MFKHDNDNNDVIDDDVDRGSRNINTLSEWMNEWMNELALHKVH